MKMLEQQQSAITKAEKFESHENAHGKKPDALDPFADVRDGGKFQILKEEKEKAIATLKEKKLLPDGFGIDGLEEDGSKNGGKDGGKKPGGKDGWVDCIKPVPNVKDGLTFDPDKVPNMNGGEKETIKKPGGNTHENTQGNSNSSENDIVKGKPNALLNENGDAVRKNAQ